MARKLPYKDPAGDMAKAQLQKIEMYAAKLNNVIHPNDELESWVQSKLSRIATDIGDVKHHLDYEMSKSKKKMEKGGDVANTNVNAYNVGFKYEKENDEDAVKIVKIYAQSKAEAEKVAEEKYKPFYDDFEIVEINYLKYGGEVTATEMLSAREVVGEEVWKNMSYKDRADVTEYLIMKGYVEEEPDELMGMDYIPSMEEASAMQYEKGGKPKDGSGIESEMLVYQYQKKLGKKAPKWFLEMPLEKKKLVIQSIK